MHREVEAMADRGLRILVMARRILPADTRRISHEDVAQLTLLGLVGMIGLPSVRAVQRGLDKDEVLLAIVADGEGSMVRTIS